MKVVVPAIVPTFAIMYKYQDNTTLRTGSDFEALKYLSTALNFKFT